MIITAGVARQKINLNICPQIYHQAPSLFSTDFHFLDLIVIYLFDPDLNKTCKVWRKKPIHWSVQHNNNNPAWLTGMLSVDKHECANSANETHAETAWLITSPPVKNKGLQTNGIIRVYIYRGITIVARFIVWFFDPSNMNPLEWAKKTHAKAACHLSSVPVCWGVTISGWPSQIHQHCTIKSFLIFQ